jgi:hypothetical protein
MRYHRKLMIVAIIAALSGCVPSQSFDHSAAAAIQEIAIAGPDDRIQYVVSTAGASSATVFHDEFDAEMAQLGFHLGKEIRASLAHALHDAGYETAEVSIPHKKGKLLEPSQVRDVQADAVLDATIISVSYDQGLFSSSLTPSLLVDVQLVDTKSGKILFGRRYIYTMETIGPRVTILAADPRYTFESYDALLDNPEMGANGLRAAAPMIAANVAQAISK